MEIALDPPPVEFRLLLLIVGVVPIADPHHLPQGPVVLGKVLELIVVAVAAQPCRGQHENLPVAQARPSALGVGLPVDIAGDGLENGVTHLGPAIDVLEGAENWDGFVAAVEVQGDFGDGRTIQSPLTIEGFPHRFAPRRFGRARAGFGEIHGSGTNLIHSSRSILCADSREFKHNTLFATDTKLRGCQEATPPAAIANAASMTRFILPCLCAA